jgi:predicted esterase
MESILKKLYYGCLNREQYFYDKNPEYRSINEKTIKVMETLEKKVSDEDYKTILKLTELHTESLALETADAFECGFKQGALIMLEVLKDEKRDKKI